MYEANYKAGKREGICKKYYISGKLKGEAIYKNNKLNGIYKMYYEDGRLKEQGTYVHGVRKGIPLWQYCILYLLNN